MLKRLLSNRLFDCNFGIDRYIRSLYLQYEFFLNNIKYSDIILFGDSVIEYTQDNDRLHDSIAKRLSLLLRTNLFSFSGGSFSSLLWNIILNRAFDKHDNINYETKEFSAFSNKYCIIELNLRCFSDEWFLRPSYKYNHINSLFLNKNNEDKIIEEYFSDKLYNLTESYYDTKLDNIKNFKMYSGCSCEFEKNIISIKSIYDFFKKNPTRYIDQFSFYYGYYLDRYIDRVDTLKNMVTNLLKLRSDICIYITPINYKKMNDTLINNIKNNISILKEELKNFDIKIYDFSSLIDKEHFFYDKEHLTFDGRKAVANELYKNISKCIIPGNTILNCYRGNLFQQITPAMFRHRAKVYKEIITNL